MTSADMGKAGKDSQSGNQHVDWKRNTSVVAAPGSALFLQRNRQQTVASSLCHREFGDLQGRQRTLAGKLFRYPRRPGFGGISNLYYPAKDRDAALTFQNFAIGLGATAAANILQEFVIRRFTSNAPRRDPGSGGKPLNQISRVFGSMIHEGD